MPEIYKQYVDLAQVDNLIISAIEATPLDADNRSGEQSDVWNKVYDALNELRAEAKTLPDLVNEQIITN